MKSVHGLCLGSLTGTGRLIYILKPSIKFTVLDEFNAEHLALSELEMEPSALESEI